MLCIALGIITWLALTPQPPEIASFIGWDKANHGLAFFVLAALGYFSVQHNVRIVYLLLATYGVGIEVCQDYFGFRYFELTDMIANIIGIGLFMLCSPLLLKLPLVQALKIDKELTHV